MISSISSVHPVRRLLANTIADDLSFDALIPAQRPGHLLYPLMHALPTLRSVNWLTAATFVAECGDFSQFRHPQDLMGFTGPAPAESSRGKQWRGHITKTGNSTEVPLGTTQPRGNGKGGHFDRILIT